MIKELLLYMWFEVLALVFIFDKNKRKMYHDVATNYQLLYEGWFLN